MTIFGIVQHFLAVTLLLVSTRGEFYPSIQWTPQNPMFLTNITHCVQQMSTVIIVCPNTATIVTKRHDFIKKDKLYENVWLVSRQSYERCQVNTSDSQERKLLECDRPLNLKYFSVVFKRYSADQSKPEFDPGKDYFLIATSDGSQASIKKTSGGHCRTHNMRLKFHICKDRRDPRCSSDQVCNGKTPGSDTTMAQAITATSTVITASPSYDNSSCGHNVIHTTEIYPGEPADRAKMIFSEQSYQIAVGVLLATSVMLLLTTGILCCRLHRRRKVTSATPGCSSSTSFHITLSDRGRNSDSQDGLLQWED